jgi:hypothetical protein
MAKAKTTVYIDQDVLRQARVAAARQGKRDSEIVEEALRGYLVGGILDAIHQYQREHRLTMSEDEAMELAYRELKAVRAKRRRETKR